MHTFSERRTISNLVRMMLRDVIGSEDVIGEAARHHHLAGVELKAGVPEPGSELQVGAAHPGAGLLLQVHPPAVAQGRQRVVETAVDDEAALLLPRLDGGHGLPGAAHGGVISRVITDN